MTDKIRNRISFPSRRNFLKGAAALMGGSAADAGRINDGARAEGDPIPVGQAAPLTDFAAADGVEFKNGLTLACEEINALGGILGRPLEPYFEDTKQMGDATNVQAVQRLIDRHGGPCRHQRLQHRLGRRRSRT
jgi:branched-chain amino acid transport system substrate-binding protein